MRMSDSKFFGVLLIIFAIYTLYKGGVSFYFGFIVNYGIYNYIIVFVAISLGSFLLLKDDNERE